MQADAVQRCSDCAVIGWMRELHSHQRPAAKIHAPRDSVPEQHGEHARNAEDQREGEKVPFLAKKIDVGIAKELHLVI